MAELSVAVRTLILRNGTRVTIGPSWSVTTLPGGREVHAHPQVPSDDQRYSANVLGYHGDVDAMTRDHDALHSLLTDWLGLPASYAMREAAGTLSPAEHELAILEEDAVLAVQRLLRAAGLQLPEPMR